MYIEGDGTNDQAQTLGNVLFAFETPKIPFLKYLPNSSKHQKAEQKSQRGKSRM